MTTDRTLVRLTQIPGVRSLWRRFPLGPVATRVRYGVFDRPHYAYGVYSAADLARRLGISAISVVEMGVAGGRGLVALERIAQEVQDSLSVQIHVVGFDSGEGMPPPADYRDLAHVWGQGFYRMDVPALSAELSAHTELILGDIEQTVPSWNPKGVVGFIAFDLDYYSSTMAAFRLFERHSETRLPRTYCYFDDLMWPEHACHNEYVGELCAIREFNAQNEHKKLCPINLLRYTRPHQDAWNEQMYVLHDFKHPLYCQNVTLTGDQYSQMPL